MFIDPLAEELNTVDVVFQLPDWAGEKFFVRELCIIFILTPPWVITRRIVFIYLLSRITVILPSL
jgi:hypothetical protein